MIATDFQNETLIPISKAAKAVPGNVCVRTVWRWTLHGCRGAKLESVLIGGRRYTTREAIDRFLAAINSTCRSTSNVPVSARRRRAIEKAEAELREAGL